MDRILELLSTETLSDISIAAQLLNSEVLQSANEQSKHKLKTRISAYLKSSGTTRAYGAVLARLALNDWSIVKSHGASWATIMLHVLDLPDQVCWLPVTKTLNTLFTKVHGKPDLSREIAGTKIGDFLKRLVATVEVTGAYSVVSNMLIHYPTQCRPYINKLEPILKSSGNTKAGFALACLCISEKQGSSIWETKVVELLDSISISLSEKELWHKIAVLKSYIDLSTRLNVTVPVENIFEKICNYLLTSLKPHCVNGSLDFMIETFELLQTSYLQKFDVLVYRLSDVVDMGTATAIKVFEIMELYMHSAGWIPENYSKLLSRFTKKAIAIWNSRKSGITGAEGLADFVQNASKFTSSKLDVSQVQILLNFFTSVAVNAVGIPQSVRILVDKIVVEHGTDYQISLITLYPGKYSMLPLSVHKMPTIPGLECLIHPRFPPLQTTKHEHESITFEDEVNDSKKEVDTESTFSNSIVTHSIDPDNSKTESVANNDDASIESADLPLIPESRKPTHKIELSTPPEKRPKHVNVAQDTSKISNDEKDEKSSVNKDEEEDDEEMVIPTLSMDSD